MYSVELASGAEGVKVATTHGVLQVTVPVIGPDKLVRRNVLSVIELLSMV